MNEKVSMLKEKAKELRKTALTMIFEAQSGHPFGWRQFLQNVH